MGSTGAVTPRIQQFPFPCLEPAQARVVVFVADRVNLRTELLPRSCRILIEQRLNPIMVLHEQRPDLLPLFRSQLQIFRKHSKFLVDRLRCMDMLKLLTRRGLLYPIVLSYGRTCIPSISITPYATVKGRFRMDGNLLEDPRRNPSQDSFYLDGQFCNKLRLVRRRSDVIVE